MAYTKQTWENLPSTNTPITADRLNHMEDGIYNAYEINNSYSTSQTKGYSCEYLNTQFSTAGIEESGSDYIRYVDGTQICWGSGNGVSGSFKSNGFTKPFISAPKVTASYQGNQTGLYIYIAVVGEVSTTACNIGVWFIEKSNMSNSGLGTDPFNYIAIGKWK